MKHIIGILFVLSVILLVMACASEEEVPNVVNTGTGVEMTEATGSHTTEWLTQVLRSPETSLCYEIITNRQSNSFDAVQVNPRRCD